MAKGKRAEKAEERDEGYEFKLPEFNEKAFIRREVASAKASFYIVGIGVLAGILAVVLNMIVAGSWALGWIPIFGAMATLRPTLLRLGFTDEVVAWKALIGSYFMLFFTGLSVWIVGVNLV